MASNAAGRRWLATIQQQRDLAEAPAKRQAALERGAQYEGRTVVFELPEVSYPHAVGEHFVKAYNYKRGRQLITGTQNHIRVVAQVERVTVWNTDDLMLWVRLPYIPTPSADWLKDEFAETGLYPLTAKYATEVR